MSKRSDTLVERFGWKDGDIDLVFEAPDRRDARRPGLKREIIEVEWVTSGSNKVCPVCEELEGQRRWAGESFELDDGTVIEASDGAAHPNCDCQVVEVNAE
jgi:hypothetical protein